MDTIRQSVFLPWIIAVVGFPIGGLLAQTIAGPAATVPTAILSGLIAGAVIGLAQGIALSSLARRSSSGSSGRPRCSPWRSPP